MKQILSVILAATLLASPVGAQYFDGEQRQWGPRGNGTLEHEDDLRWVFFHDAKITADEAKGVYRAAFSPTLRKEDGLPFSITGYMLPVEAKSTSPHFVLTRRSTGCPFCPPNELTEAIDVFATKPIDYTQSPVTVSGRLHLISQSAQGLFFRMDRAKVQ